MDDTPLPALAGWFAAGVGPNAYRLDKPGAHLKAMADTAAMTVDGQLAQAKVLDANASEADLSARKKRLQSAALQKAREAMAKKPRESRSLMLTNAPAQVGS